MTNAPGRFRAPAVRANRAKANAAGPTVWWRLGASAWLLLLLFGGGSAAWLGFGILAVIGRRRSWGIFAGVYAVAAIIVAIPEDPAGHIMEGTLYLVILVHGLIINQAWLLLLWGRRENNLTVFGTARGPNARNAPPTGPRQRAAAIPEEAQKLLGGGGTAKSDYLADAPPAPRRRRPTRAQQRAQAAVAAAATAAPPVPVAAADLVDVNTANQRTIARLTGMDRGLAKTVIADRARRGGFGSLEDFAASAGLQPHELVRLRAEAFCSARPRAKRSFGRRVDY